jgi:hypothetical protein
MTKIDRRNFLKGSLVAGATLAVYGCDTMGRPSGRILSIKTVNNIYN